MYNENDIQNILNEYRNNEDFKQLIKEQTTEYRKIYAVMNDGAAEYFYRYDSDICEQFLYCYELFLAKYPEEKKKLKK